MEFDLPLYAVQRLADGTWLVRTLMGDPIMPAVDVVAVVGAPTSAAPSAGRPPFGRGAGAAIDQVTGCNPLNDPEQTYGAQAHFALSRLGP